MPHLLTSKPAALNLNRNNRGSFHRPLCSLRWLAIAFITKLVTACCTHCNQTLPSASRAGREYSLSHTRTFRNCHSGGWLAMRVPAVMLPNSDAALSNICWSSVQLHANCLWPLLSGSVGSTTAPHSTQIRRVTRSMTAYCCSGLKGSHRRLQTSRCRLPRWFHQQSLHRAPVVLCTKSGRPSPVWSQCV